MVYTLTFTPCLDYSCRVDDLKLFALNASEKPSIHAGGKGINCAIMLSRLGKEVKALGFLGGKIGSSILSEVQKEGVNPDFVIIDEENRFNYKIRDGKGNTTEINGLGPNISDKELYEIYRKLDQIEDGDYLIISGSVPPTIDHFIYAEIMKYLIEKKVKVVVDARKDLLKNTFEYHPFLIKPNQYELAELFDITLEPGEKMANEDIEECMLELLDEGVQNVLVSLGKYGAKFVGSDRKIINIDPIEGPAISHVGSGDSMIAGFVAGLAETDDINYALKLAMACGTATAFSSWLATVDEVSKLL